MNDKMDINRQVESLDLSSQANRNLLVFFLLLLLTIVSIVSQTEHIDFLLNNNVRVPLIGLEFPTFSFYVLAPILILTVHFAVLLNYERHKIKLNKYLETKNNDRSIFLYPYMFNFNNTYEDNKVLSFLLNIVIWVIFIGFPLGTLLFMQYTFLPYRSFEITLWHMIAVIIDIVFIGLLFLDVLNKLRKKGKEFLLICLFLLIASLCTIYFFCTIFKKISFNNLELVENTKLAKTKPSNEILIYYLDKNMSEEYVWREKTEQLDLSGKDFSYAILKNIKFYNVDLSKVNLSKATLENSHLKEIFLKSVDLSGANLKEAQLIGADLSRADLSESNLLKANLSEAQLIGTDLKRASLIGVNLRGADLSGADLSGAELLEMNLREIDVIWKGGYRLKTSKLKVDLTGANLSGVNLSKADLKNVNISDTIMDISTFNNLVNNSYSEGGIFITMHEDINISKDINFSGVYIINKNEYKINGEIPNNKNKDEFIKRKKDLACKSKIIAKQFNKHIDLFKWGFGFNSYEYIQKNCPNILKD